MSRALAAGDVIGSYRLLGPLGHGGMAAVWLAETVDNGRRVVLKFPDVDQLGDPAVFERFRREVEIGRKVDHPAVAKAIEVREDWHHPYLVMEYVEGQLLSDLLRAEGVLPVDRAVALSSQLLLALAHLHKQEVFHRDLKPENLVVTPDGRVRIIDFGIALMDSRPRVTWRGFSGLIGTPEYMAPEQIRGERGGASVDIYAAGVILYEMLAGRPPFAGDNPLAVMYQAVNEAPPPLSRFRTVPRGLENVVLRALYPDRSGRFATAEEFRCALLAPDAVEAPPARAGKRLRGRARISPGGMALLAALLAGLLTVAAILWFRGGR